MKCCELGSGWTLVAEVLVVCARHVQDGRETVVGSRSKTVTVVVRL